MAKIADFLTTAQRREMIVSKTMSRVVPGLALDLNRQIDDLVTAVESHR